MRWLLLRTLVAIGLLLGCRAAPITPILDEFEELAAQKEVRPRWPRPPAESRIVLLGEIASARSFERNTSIWERIRSLLTDEEDIRLVRPAAICVRDSVMAVTDPGAGAVHIIDLYKRRWRIVEKVPAGRLRSPVGVACLPGGRLLVADSLLNSLWLYDAEGDVARRFSQEELQRPTGIDFDEIHERVWVAETAAHRLRAFDLDGREILRAGKRGTGDEEFNYPTMLAADSLGGVWVTDSLNFRLQHIDASGVLDGRFGLAGDRAGAFARPRGLAVDADGRILAVDGLLDAVQIFNAEGQLLLAFGGRGTNPGQFWLPSDIALDVQGHVYVVDSYNHRVQVFAYRPPPSS